jgi:uncharacterized membrane protein (DUF2068 family)
MVEPVRRDRLIIVIGIAKLVKALVLVAAAVSVLATMNDRVRTWLHELASGSGRDVMTKLVADLSGSSHHKIELIATLLVLYAALYTVEGVGLLARKVWAEWLTIIITCSFIPFEVYEVIAKGSWIKALVLVANILIAIYLIARRIHARHKHGLMGWLREHFG